MSDDEEALKRLEALPLYASSQPRRKAAKKAAWGEDMEAQELLEMVQDLPASAASMRRRKQPQVDLKELQASMEAHALVQRRLQELSARVERRERRLSQLRDEARGLVQGLQSLQSLEPEAPSAASPPRPEGAAASPVGSPETAVSFWSTCFREGLRRVCKRPSSPDASGGLARSAFQEVFATQLVANPRDARRVSFVAYYPEVFRALRLHAFGVSEESFMRSMCDGPLSGGQQGEGKSGMLFFSSWDKKYLAKTVMPKEIPFFAEQLGDYHAYMKGCPGSFLPHFMGLYSLQFPKERLAYLVVFRNLFPPGLRFEAKYDLKGVLGQHRYVSAEQRASGVEVLKDRNFLERTALRLVQTPLRQLEQDVDFLEKHGRIDYSLLLGVALSSKAQDAGLRTLPGDEMVFMGIIDILQEYGKTKAMESTLKSLQYSLKGLRRRSNVSDLTTAVSSMPPAHYAKRFMDFMKQVFV